MKQKKHTKGFNIQSRERVYNGFYQLEKVSVKFQLYNESWSPVVDRELFQRGDAAGILLVDADENQVVLVEQFRIGAVAEEDPWLLDVVAGGIDAGSNPVQTVIKEAKEEAGLDIGVVSPIMTYYPSPGACSERIHLYYAFVKADQAAKYAGCEQEHEDIRVVTVSINEAIEALGQGKFISSPAIISLQWLRDNRHNLANLKAKSV